MEQLQFGYNDRKFLRSIHIDPQPNVRDDMEDILRTPAIFRPDTIYISAALARVITAKYGELNLSTYVAYVNDRSNQDKK